MQGAHTAPRWQGQAGQQAKKARGEPAKAKGAVPPTAVAMVRAESCPVVRGPRGAVHVGR